MTTRTAYKAVDNDVLQLVHDVIEEFPAPYDIEMVIENGPKEDGPES